MGAGLAEAATAVRPEIWLLFLIVCSLGTLLYLQEEEGFTDGSDSTVTTLPGWMVFVFDSKKADTTTNNQLMRFIKEGASQSPTLDMLYKFRLDDTHMMNSIVIDLDREEFKEIRPFFPNSMGLYINTGGDTPGLYLNNDFGPSRIRDQAAAKKLLSVFLHAKSQADLVEQVSQHFHMYLEERPDSAIMEQNLLRIYKNYME